MENKNRSVFSLHGVTGMLIATVLLLSILVVLTILGIKAQQSVADKPYVLKDPVSVEKRSNIDVQNKTIVIKE